MIHSRGFASLCVAVLLFAAACASRQPLVTIGPAKGETVITMKASDFEFVPNNIRAYKGDILLLKIENTSGTGHNFTIKDPGGKTVQSVPLPSKETVTVKVDLADSGTYEFYCDKPFHAAFGMKGWIQVDQ
jgi:plastocyanin